MAGEVLGRFSGAVRDWFTGVFEAPTAAQEEAWESISSGRHSLVVAPTGSGKTLAAFLWAIDRLASAPGQLSLGGKASGPAGSGGVKVLYISPLKALGVDVERNLRAPLTGIARAAERRGESLPPITVGVRSGDTPAAERARQQRRPPDILITTPESAYLMLTSKAAGSLSGVETVVVDEIHSVAGTKRGAHLALSLERLALLAGEFQRIGLSATVRPVEEVARFLGGDRPVEIIDPPANKSWDLSVTVPVPDMADLPVPEDASTIGDAVLDDEEGLARPLGGEDDGEDSTVPTGGALGVDESLDPGPVGLDLGGEGTQEPVGADDSLDPGPVGVDDAPDPGPVSFDDPPDDEEDAAPGAAPGPAGPEVGAGSGSSGPVAEDSALPTQKSIWPFIEKDLYEAIMASRSTLVFVNSRRSAERLTSRINELYAKEHDPEALSVAARRDPAQLMKQTDTAGHARAVIARAHHGSVSKEERAEIEDQLKSGELRSVVATSSLELGIDMGLIEQVVQVESPPSVASGLQRVGRAGHGVGEVSRGRFYPKHRADVLSSALVVERMRVGAIEETRTPLNPLDVLAQQTVAEVAARPISTDDWFDAVRRAAPYRELPREAFDSVIDLLRGIYPSTDFSELKPRIVVDAETGEMTPRPGAQRVAVTSGGTIPDRGMFGVFLLGTEADGKAPRRVGELDEEMVYESRVGDVITLGASSWRVEDITKDQVLVSPAPGHTGRLPFWNGDQAGRPAELGAALGEFRRRLAADPEAGRESLLGLGLDEWAADNALAFLNEQREATGQVPDERTLLLERFTDELGDWRVVVHSPYGRGVNAAWALAVGDRISEETGMDAQPVAGDDGIVLRLPAGEEEPTAALLAVDPEEVEDIVAEKVGDSALFASRFRECAARALLLPRRNPGARAPLWQQRQRAAQLLDVARSYPSFPIILETVRECLRDVYDLPALKRVLSGIEQRTVRVAEVTTEQPSPCASTLLFSYTGAFMYEGDSPLAEKRAAALSLDPALLGKLLGTVELSELLRPEIVEEVHEELQRLSPNRRARGPEELVDALRSLGPVPLAGLAARCSFPEPAAATLAAAPGRVMEVRIAGEPHLAVASDAALLRDGLGVPVPPGVGASPKEVPDALEQLLGRWARSRGPFTARAAADAFGLPVSAAHAAIGALTDRRRLTRGRFTRGTKEDEYCDREVLSRIRRRSLAAARAETRPVSQSGFARFLLGWQQVAPVGDGPALSGPDGVLQAVEQLAGVRLPASAWETLVLPQRVAGYRPGDLDELTLAGEVIVVGAGQAGANDPWLELVPADVAEQLVAPRDEEPYLSELEEAVLGVLAGGGGFRFADIAAEVKGADLPGLASGEVGTERLAGAMWSLVEAGLISPDSLAPVRARLSGRSAGGAAAHRQKTKPRRSRLRLGRTSFAQAHRAGREDTPPDMRGRWSLSPRPTDEPTTRSVALGEAWLDRYGVVTRGSVAAEGTTGGFQLAYKVLSTFEENGRAMRGHLVEGLGAAQFSTPAVIDRLRGHDDAAELGGWPSGAREPKTHVLAAADPANPYGAALPWPEQGPTRAAGGLVVLADGLLVAHLTRGGRRLSLFPDALPEDAAAGAGREEAALVLAAGALQDAVAAGTVRPFTVETINGQPALGFVEPARLRAAGLGVSPKGVAVAAPGRAPAQPAAGTGRGRAPGVGRGGPRRGRNLSEALDESSRRGRR